MLSLCTLLRGPGCESPIEDDRATKKVKHREGDPNLVEEGISYSAKVIANMRMDVDHEVEELASDLEFDDSDVSVDKSDIPLSLLMSSLSAFVKDNGEWDWDRVEHDICWVCPPKGHVKINTDSSLRSSDNCAFGGGLCRDATGNWLFSFAASYGISSVLGAELWSMYEGLRLAYDIGYRKVILECDNLTAVNTILGVSNNQCILRCLVDSIRSLLLKDWMFKFTTFIGKQISALIG
ncbi:hypothetical protein GH714_039118 [Hevea brasiliensis]|uniref:RNase H type-1 domain-containing protein n=1 Tax=Hevea brasiliensis TaxID=3981 RepID=A0A6A6KPB3_HEVBR|nr:hypothetical protein GH714_039118 [Hevea brasiliensis]